MSAAALVCRGKARFALQGVLDFDSVSSLLEEEERLFTDRGRLDLDLGAVRKVNSAGLALLLEWSELARRRKLDLRLHNMPDSLTRLAELANVSGLLPVFHACDRNSACGAATPHFRLAKGESDGHDTGNDRTRVGRARHDR